LSNRNQDINSRVPNVKKVMRLLKRWVTWS